MEVKGDGAESSGQCFHPGESGGDKDIPGTFPCVSDDDIHRCTPEEAARPFSPFYDQNMVPVHVVFQPEMGYFFRV